MSRTPQHRTTIGLRGRISLPTAVQEAAGVGVGDALVVRAAGDGVIVLETLEARRRAQQERSQERRSGVVEYAWSGVVAMPDADAVRISGVDGATGAEAVVVVVRRGDVPVLRAMLPDAGGWWGVSGV